MKFDNEDPRLTAYVLGELPADEARQMDHAVAADPALRLAVEEIEKQQSRLADVLGGDCFELLPRQKSEIMRAAKEATRVGRVVELKSHKQIPVTFIWPVAAAAVIGLGIFAMTLISPDDKRKPGDTVAKGGDDKSQSDNAGSDSNDRSSVQIPLRAGEKSLSLVANSIRNDGRLPDHGDVRIEELLNAFPLAAKDAVAISNGCSIGTEIVQCPWKPSASLLLVHIRGDREADHEMKVEFRKKGKVVTDFEMLGHRSGTSSGGAAVAEVMKKGEEIFAAILVSATGDDLGLLAWSVDGEEAPPILLERDNSEEASSDARFAALVCSFGLWLREEKRESIDEEVILGQAREVAADTTVPDRYDFLELVDQAVKLED